MSACARAITVLALFCGCFSDGGADLTQTASSPEPATETGSTTTTATTGPTDPTSTGEPEPATTTTTGEPGTGTTAPPLCPGEMQCEPGAVMDHGLCDACGRLQSTCQPDCTWGADECAQDLSSCAYWYLDDLQQGWQRVALPQPLPPHAPSAPAHAAFDLQAHDQLVVLTASTYHALRHSDQTWIASGPLTELFPGLPFPLLQSYAVYNDVNNTYDVYAVGDPLAWVYVLQPGSYQGQFALEGDCCGSFTQELMPNPADVRDLYADLAAPFPWTPGEFYADCVGEFFPLERHGGWLTPTDVYIQEVGVCFQLEFTTPLAQFPPFAAPGAPPGDLLGGAALLGERFYVFAGE